MDNVNRHYSYAKTKDEMIISIDDVSEKDRYIAFSCPGCGDKLIPRIGPIRIHHFAHASLNKFNACGYESYLHKISKMLLAHKLNKLKAEGKPFKARIFHKIIAKDSNGNTKIVRNQENMLVLNILDRCRSIKLEKKAEKFRPDITICYEDGKQLFLEINVTHTSTLEKITASRLIELDVNSEEDIKRICSSFDEVYDKFYGFDNFRKMTEKTSCIRAETPAKILSSIQEEDILNSLYHDFENGILDAEIDYDKFSFGCCMKTTLPDFNKKEDCKGILCIRLTDFFDNCELLWSGKRPYCHFSRKNVSWCLNISFDSDLKDQRGNKCKSIVLCDRFIEPPILKRINYISSDLFFVFQEEDRCLSR